MVKTGKCTSCGAHRILKKENICKRCNMQGLVVEEEEVAVSE